MGLLEQWRRVSRRVAPEAAQGRAELLSSLLVMAWVVEARDPYTGGHLWRVSRFAELLARKAGFTEREVARISIGGFLHDLGKVGVPDAVLRKTGRLTESEYEQIRTHPELGYRMLAGHPLAALVIDAVRLHHETPDGAGYPLGLTAEAIPLAARIVAICDAFDAMTSNRPYRPGMPTAQALQIIRDNLGRQFDETYGRLFLELGESGQLEHFIGHSDDGIPLQHCPSCGPTVVRRREQPAGDLVYCPVCTTEFCLEGEGAGAQPMQPSGRLGSAEQLQAHPDNALIERLMGHLAAPLLG